MKKFLLATLMVFAMVGVTLAADVLFVSYDKDKKTLKVKESKDDKEPKSYTVSDKTTFKSGEKDIKAEKGAERLEKLKAGAKLSVTLDKETVTEVKFAAPKPKADK